MLWYSDLVIRFNKKLIYLDYASATPLDEKVSKTMSPYESAHFANAGSIHSEGVLA